MKAMLSSCWGQVGLAGAPQITLNTKDRGNNRNLLTVFQSELTSHSVFLQKGPEVICQDAEYFLAQLTIVSGMAKGVSDRYTMGLVVYVFRP